MASLPVIALHSKQPPHRKHRPFKSKLLELECELRFCQKQMLLEQHNDNDTHNHSNDEHSAIAHLLVMPSPMTHIADLVLNVVHQSCCGCNLHEKTHVDDETETQAAARVINEQCMHDLPVKNLKHRLWILLENILNKLIFNRHHRSLLNARLPAALPHESAPVVNAMHKLQWIQNNSRVTNIVVADAYKNVLDEKYVEEKDNDDTESTFRDLLEQSSYRQNLLQQELKSLQKMNADLLAIQKRSDQQVRILEKEIAEQMQKNDELNNVVKAAKDEVVSHTATEIVLREELGRMRNALNDTLKIQRRQQRVDELKADVDRLEQHNSVLSDELLLIRRLYEETLLSVRQQSNGRSPRSGRYQIPSPPRLLNSSGIDWAKIAVQLIQTNRNLAIELQNETISDENKVISLVYELQILSKRLTADQQNKENETAEYHRTQQQLLQCKHDIDLLLAVPQRAKMLGFVRPLGNAKQFTPFGTDDTIPIFLRSTHKIPNKHYSKRECEMLIRWLVHSKLEHDARLGFMTMHLVDWMHLSIRAKYGPTAPEIAYNLLDACSRYAWDADVELFIKVLHGNLPEEVVHDSHRMMGSLIELFVQLRTIAIAQRTINGLPMSFIQSALCLFFPSKTEEDMQKLIGILQKMFTEQPQAAVNYAMLFAETKELNESSFVEEIRDSHLHEYETFMSSFVDAWATLPAVDGLVQINDIVEMWKLLDENATLAYINACLADGIGVENNEFETMVTYPKKSIAQLRRSFIRPFKLWDPSAVQEVWFLKLPRKNASATIRTNVKEIAAKLRQSWIFVYTKFTHLPHLGRTSQYEDSDGLITKQSSELDNEFDTKSFNALLGIEHA